ncbi:MAG: helix-turn-helix domain-containing protein [Euryarchaeota archaeon]|nr:helix-turn-helix domain-containing protein [Euryarchaeota archaeon]MDE2045620.1 helix-turn-helix domain-containing protein [Thermoplasmata archaeon]
MPLVDAQVRARHPCAYTEVCLEAPGSTLLRWFDLGRNVLLLSNRTSRGLERLLKGVREVFRASCLAREGLEAVAVVPDLGWTDPRSLEGSAGRTGVWIVPPITIQEGQESCRVVARDPRALRGFTDGLRRSGPVELLAVTSRGDIAALMDPSGIAAHLFEGMSDPQVRSLVAAWDGGLFHVPARARWGEVSDRLRLSRSTFGEHVRKGQFHLVQNAIPALRFRASRVPERIALPSLPPPTTRRKAPQRGTRSGPG